MPSRDECASFIKRSGIYFYFHDHARPIEDETTHYTIMNIVDGLRELEIPCFSNVQDSRFIHRIVGQARDQVVVVDATESNYTPDLVNAFAAFEARAKIFHSRADTAPDMITPPGMTAVMAHENAFAQFHENRIPWVFGLSHKRIKNLENKTAFSDRQNVLLRNFRPSYNQSVRDSLDCALIPTLEKFFTIDDEISASWHAYKLSNYAGCLAYGGHFCGDLAKNDFFKNHRYIQEMIQHRRYIKPTVISRWDSWRFWESLAAGCLTIHLDAEKYGFKFPVAPVAWKHYVPLDLEDPKGFVDELIRRKPEWADIAHAGKEWALEHYSPLPTARRFVEICVDELQRGSKISASPSDVAKISSPDVAMNSTKEVSPVTQTTF